MGLLDGDRDQGRTGMSWESVLDEAAAADQSAAGAPDVPADGAPPATTTAPPAVSAPDAAGAPPPSDPLSPLGELKLHIPPIDLSGATGAPVVEPVETPVLNSEVATALPADPPPPPPEPVEVRTAAPTSLPTNDPEPPAEVSFSIPDIQQATPVAPLTDHDQAELAASNPPAPPDPAAFAPPPATPEPAAAPIAFEIESPIVDPTPTPAPGQQPVSYAVDPTPTPAPAQQPVSYAVDPSPTPPPQNPSHDSVSYAVDPAPTPPPAEPVSSAVDPASTPAAEPAPAPGAEPDAIVPEGPVAAPPAAAPTAHVAMPSPAVPPPAVGHHPAQAAHFERAAQRVPTVGGLVAEPAAPSTARRSRKGRVVATLFALLLIGALVAGSLTFGREYLFPEESWDEATQPYAEAVETARGVDFSQTFVVTGEPRDAYLERRSTDLLGDWEAELPVWRALALANGDIDQASLDTLLDGWNPALYSPEDGQVYHDATIPGAELDAWITTAMAAAALDQELAWSTGRAGRTLDDAALTEAHLMRQTAAIQTASSFDAPIANPDATPLTFLPPVLGYRVIAPTMYAELLAEPAAGEVNPLADIGRNGPGPLAPEPPVDSATASLAPGDTVVAPGAARDRSFWYLVFASYLDAPTAYLASDAVEENTLTVVDRAGRTCAVATFSGGDVGQTAALTLALDGWAAAAPVELGATSEALEDGTMQFTSCDPGAGFENGARFGVARELIGWRLAEIATVVTVVESGGSEADVDDALLRLAQSDAGAQIAALPFDTSPTIAAATARAAVADVAAAPVVEPLAEPEPDAGGG